MTRKTETEPMLRGHAKHRRTQSDYMGALLDRVTLETWGDVIDATVAKAKDGDAHRDNLEKACGKLFGYRHGINGTDDAWIIERGESA